MGDPVIQELAARARQLIYLPPALEATSVEQAYDHPLFVVSKNSDRLLVSLRNPDRPVYYESLQLFPTGTTTGFQANPTLAAKCLSIMRQVMILDDLASI